MEESPEKEEVRVLLPQKKKGSFIFNLNITQVVNKQVNRIFGGGGKKEGPSLMGPKEEIKCHWVKSLTVRRGTLSILQNMLTFK